MANTRFRFQIGQTVRVGDEGTSRFPIPLRYAGRQATIVNRSRSGKSTKVYGVEFPSNRRVAPLLVTEKFLASLG